MTSEHRSLASVLAGLVTVATFVFIGSMFDAGLLQLSLAGLVQA